MRSHPAFACVERVQITQADARALERALLRRFLETMDESYAEAAGRIRDMTTASWRERVAHSRVETTAGRAR